MNCEKLHNPCYAGLILRLTLGVMFLAHAWLKYSVFTLDGVDAYFVSLGLPGEVGRLVFVAELLAGGFLILGLHVRCVAMASIVLLLGAAWAHWSNGWLFTNQGGGWEYPVFMAATALALVFHGGGSYGVCRLNAKPTPTPAPKKAPVKKKAPAKKKRK